MSAGFDPDQNYVRPIYWYLRLKHHVPEISDLSISKSIFSDGKSNDKKVDYKIPAAEIRNMGVDIIAIGAGSVDKTQLLEMTGQRSDKIFTGYVSQILI